MNFNYDLVTWIDYFLAAFACCLGIFISDKILLDIKFKDIKWYSYLLLVVFTIFIVFNTLLFDNVAKIFGSLLIFFLIPKLTLRENSSTSFIYSILNYILILISEVTVSLILVLLGNIFQADLYTLVQRTVFINITISFILCIYSKLATNKIRQIVNKFNKNIITYIFILGIIILFVMLSSMYNLYLNNWKIDYSFILNLIIFIGSIILTIVLAKQYVDNKEVTNKYLLLNDYLKTSAELIEKYSATTHKYKNNLIIIKGYMKSDMKEANKYIDSLLDQMENKKYSWVKKINYIPIDTIRYLIYYKLSKAETENLKIVVDVSEDLKTLPDDIIRSKEIHILADMIGELFDNAIYASSESKEKELNLVIYKEEDNIVFTLSNTYKGEIDLTLITNNGFTTKGKGHGFGLYDIDKTIRRNDWLKLKYELLDNYFVTILKINKDK